MEKNGGKAPDYVFLCAGFARPKFFVDATSEELQSVSRLSLFPCLDELTF